MARLAYLPFEGGPAGSGDLDAILRKIGFPQCRPFNRGSTQAFVARDPTAGLGILAFRGTQRDQWADLKADLDAILIPWDKGGKVHEGFAKALSEVWSDVMADLASPPNRLVYTGHSLGAALATLAASRHPPQALYTFGSPRVGDQAFLDSLPTFENRRYVDCCDIVCRLPPEVGYRHLGPARYLDRTGQESAEPSSGFIRSDQWIARLDFTVRHAWRPGNVWFRDLADHAPINYVSCFNPQP